MHGGGNATEVAYLTNLAMLRWPWNPWSILSSWLANCDEMWVSLGSPDDDVASPPTTLVLERTAAVLLNPQPVPPPLQEMTGLQKSGAWTGIAI